MSDKATVQMNSRILLDEIKTTWSGTYDYDIDTVLASSSGNGWIYAEKTVGTAAGANLLGTTEDYLGSATGAAAVAVGDKIKWIAIKHTGTSDGVETTGNSIAFTLDANGSNAYGDVDAIILDPGELLVLKVPNCTVESFHALSVAMSDGAPTATGTSNIRVKVAAILQNVG